MGPTSTFEFDGESSGLLGPGESRWPFTSGYAFATWSYMESFADSLNSATTASVARSGESAAMSSAAAASALAGEGIAHMPRLFSFLSVDNHGRRILCSVFGSGKGALDLILLLQWLVYKGVDVNVLYLRRWGLFTSFKESIVPEKMARLASKGGDVLPSFEIGGSLHLLYHPKLLSGYFCPNASTSAAAGTHRRPF
ncbi:hypothetical protein MKW98_026615 [Papaver atlanticum]|uniref:Uncharacterized protein n=1 Tax=Papaver atlanticum TaxID=357466 RepID=A0AAD4S025_9MAGN|nr:hypothetical protein MKW98_026615 [Papaver atlanticum]